ncbi:SAM-dependent methyltransferase, partial [Rhizobium ruizarguesonis]
MKSNRPLITFVAMHADIVDLRQFYHSELGRLAEQSIAMA